MVQLQNKNRTRSGMYSIKTSCKEMNKTLISTKTAPTNDKTVGIWCIIATWKKTGHYSSIFRFFVLFFLQNIQKFHKTQKDSKRYATYFSISKIRNSNNNLANYIETHSNLIL